MSTRTTNLFLPQDLEDDSRTRQLATGDLQALEAVASWIKSFVARPHKDLGRAGTVCPFVPGSLERKVLWLAPERIDGREGSEVVELVKGYVRLFLETEPAQGEDADYKVIVIVFTDLSADRAHDVFGDALGQLAVPSYADAGILFGPFYEGNQGAGLYNPRFHPFQSPVPFLFVRQGVISDWKFFVDNQAMLDLWAGRYGQSGVRALVDELRRTNWRQLG